MSVAIQRKDHRVETLDDLAFDILRFVHERREPTLKEIRKVFMKRGKEKSTIDYNYKRLRENGLIGVEPYLQDMRTVKCTVRTSTHINFMRFKQPLRSKIIHFIKNSIQGL